MKKLFLFNSLTAERREQIRSTAKGAYLFDFRAVTAEQLFLKSRGLSISACGILAGKWILFETMRETAADGLSVVRAIPVREQFTREEWAKLDGGSLRLQAIAARYYYLLGNALIDGFTPFHAFCTKCGKIFKTASEASAHKCGAATCQKCGKELKTREEKSHLLCTACACARVEMIYGYHDRPTKGAPVFEYPDKRENAPHLGPELEMYGGKRDSEMSNEEASILSKTINKKPFAPCVWFEHDSSIDGGIECIFEPFTLAGLEKRAAEIDALYIKADEIGGEFDVKNGLHFHIDRKYFGTDSETRTKAAVLIDLLVYKYYDFFSAISRRRRGEFFYACKKDSVSGIFTAAANVNNHAHRYAVNGGGEHTIEIRIFGGKIACVDDFLAAADIVQAIARWAKNATMATAERATPCDIVKYIKNAGRAAAFCENARADREITTTGEAMRAEFIRVLKEAEEKREALRAEV